MKQTAGQQSSRKENKKVQTDKQSEDREVREDQNNSIYDDANKKDYPYQEEKEKQFNNQPEFIDRDSDDKDKS